MAAAKHLRSCCVAPTTATAPTHAPKRAGGQARIPSWRAKRPRTRRHRPPLGDPALHLCGFRGLAGLVAESSQASGAKRACAQRSPDYASRRAKRPRISTQIQIASRRAKRPRNSTQIQIPACWGAKRARSRVAAAEWRDWANIGEGPAGLIAECLLASDVADYMSFRAACRPWRLCSADPSAHGVLDRRFHPRHWVMLRETLPAATPHRRRLLNTSTGRCVCVGLPELAGHDVFGPYAEGLLVLLHRTTFAVRLLNPITRQAADLPPVTTLLNQAPVTVRARPDAAMVREAFKVAGAGLADDSTFAIHFDFVGILAVVEPGQGNWTAVDGGDQLIGASSSFAGRFYCASRYKSIMVVETGQGQPPRLATVAELTRGFSPIMRDTLYLVDNGGELVLVGREGLSRTYAVYRVDLEARETRTVRGLGGRAVFLGAYRAVLVSPPAFPSICADAVYLGFESLFTGKLDKSPYHLMDGTAEAREFGILKLADDLFAGNLNTYSPRHPQYGPWGIVDYLSSCVTGLHDESGISARIACSPPW
ncbi:hypothetical protein ACP4OV_018932 [Aristida adscensionis]